MSQAHLVRSRRRHVGGSLDFQHVIFANIGLEFLVSSGTSTIRQISVTWKVPHMRAVAIFIKRF